MSSATYHAIQAARSAGEPTRLVELIPYARWMGFQFEPDADGGLRGAMPFQDMLVGNPMIPALHGGTVGALLESTAVFDLLWRAETVAVPQRLPKIVNITIEYLRSGKPRDTFARSSITRLGRRVANVRALAWQDDPEKPIAAANAHFLLATPEPIEPPA